MPELAPSIEFASPEFQACQLARWSGLTQIESYKDLKTWLKDSGRTAIGLEDLTVNRTPTYDEIGIAKGSVENLPRSIVIYNNLIETNTYSCAGGQYITRLRVNGKFNSSGIISLLSDTQISQCEANKAQLLHLLHTPNFGLCQFSDYVLHQEGIEVTHLNLIYLWNLTARKLQLVGQKIAYPDESPKYTNKFIKAESGVVDLPPFGRFAFPKSLTQEELLQGFIFPRRRAGVDLNGDDLVDNARQPLVKHLHYNFIDINHLSPHQND